MSRLNAILLVVLIGCAFGVVNAQHEARRLFVALEKEQAREKQLEIEYGQLQIEQSTWSTHARVERIAARSLGMRVPEAAKIRTVLLPEPGSPAAANAAPGQQ